MTSEFELTKCLYCKDMIPKTDLYAHMNIHHYDQWSKTKKRVKIGLTFSLIGLSIAIGIIYSMFFD